MQCGPCIYQSGLVEKPIILVPDSIEVARNDPATASGLAEDVGQYLQLLSAVVQRIAERVEVHVDETEDCARRGWRVGPSVEDVGEDQPGTCDGSRGEGVNVP